MVEADSHLKLLPTSISLDMTQIVGCVVTCGVNMMSLRHSWGWQPPQTAFIIHIRHIKCLGTLICCPSAYSSSCTQLYSHYLAQLLGFWVACGVKMLSQHHGWGWQPTQTASYINIRHIQSVWAQWYAVHRHMVAASHSNTHPTSCLSFGGSSGSFVESKWCHLSWLGLTATSNCFPHPY